MQYSFISNGVTGMPQSLPERIVLPDGYTRTSLDSLSADDLAQLGWYPVRAEYPPLGTGERHGNPMLSLVDGFVVALYISEPIPTPRKTILTKLEYMSRFTDAELAAIYTAAKSVVQIEIWLEKFKLASEINLDDAATIAGLRAMEAGGLLAVGRSAEILA